MKKIMVFVLCLTLLGGLAYAERVHNYESWKASQVPPIATIVGSACNSVVCVQVNQNGDFNIGTPDGRSLLYFYPNEPGTSDIRVRVDGMMYTIGQGTACDGTAATDSVFDGDTEVITYHSILGGEITIEVHHIPVLFTGTTGAILTRTVVHNNDDVEHNIGVFYQYDTTVDGDDAAELYYGPTHLLNETCYDAPFDVTYWDAIPLSGEIVGRGTFTGGEAVVPDHLAFGQWGDFVGTCWERVCDNAPYGDSAVIYRWDEIMVAAGGSRSVATYYGVGELIVQPGDLQISVSQPPLECDDGEITPDPFQVLVNITNSGGSTCSEILVTLSDGSGPGGTGVVTSTNPMLIPSLNPGNNAAVSFTVDLTNNPAGGCVNFTVNVSSAACEPNALDFCVNVPACQQQDCEFPFTEVDMGDLHRCNYPTLVNNPAHGLSGIAWLGEGIEGDRRPDIFDHDLLDDGVVFVGLPWMPCTMEQVVVTVTGGPNYARYAACGGQLFLSAWKDGNLDGDFCDTLCQGRAPEWMIQDVPVTPGVYTIDLIDPGVFDLDVYDGAFRFRLASEPMGALGFGIRDTLVCPLCICGGTLGLDFLGEVEDYYEYDAQLAVELAGFDATANGNNIDLVWNTASETGNDRFEIFRDGSKIAEVPTQGNGASAHTYRYTDAGVSAGSHSYTLWSVDVSGDRRELATAEATPGNNVVTVTEYKLHPNYPNPFNPATSIRFDLVESGVVSLKVYNLVGQEVANLVNGSMSAGSHVVSFDAAGLPSGVYLYRLTVNGFSAEAKMLLMK